ncbi:MAG: ATP-binding protein [Dorea sp.]|nr:ATP-binding protein [Dorea sp.]
MKYEITVPAELGKLKDVNDFIVERLNELDCSPRAQIQLEIAIEEIFVNIAHYAYNPVIGKATVRMDVDEVANTVFLRFEDEGTPYNPLAREDPDITLGAEERGVGGLGIYMTKKSMDDVEYSYENGKNILVITKKIK